MPIPPGPVFALALLALWSAALPAQEQDLTPSETARMIEAIEAVKKRVGESRYGIHASSIQAFREAAESTTAAYDFYLKCYKEVHFERRGARESEYRDWKTKNVRYLRSKQHSEARRLQLKFLVITLRAARAKEEHEIVALVPELTALIDAALSVYPGLGRARSVLHEDAVGSVFGKVYDLGASLKDLPDWGRGPMDIDGIYEETVLPLYRSPEKAGQLAAAWDKRIAQSTRAVRALEDEEAEEKFVDDTLPRLRWEKYTDLLRAGRRRSALTGMVSLVQKNADHDEIDDWLDALGAYLRGEREPEPFDGDETPSVEG